jgi:hypothetical protein
MVDVVGPADSALQGARHQRRLQPRWWTLLDPPTAAPRGLAIDVFFKLGGGCYRTRQ